MNAAATERAHKIARTLSLAARIAGFTERDVVGQDDNAQVTIVLDRNEWPIRGILLCSNKWRTQNFTELPDDSRFFLWIGNQFMVTERLQYVDMAAFAGYHLITLPMS